MIFDSIDNLKARFNAVTSIKFNDGSVTEPVSLQDAKDWCRISVSDDDAIITALITTARQQCEQYAAIGFISRQIVATLTNLNGNIYFPYGPVTSTPVLLDCDGNAISNAKIDGEDFKFLVYPKLSRINATYNAGYSILPQQLKTALLQQVAYLYENRGDAQSAASLSPMTMSILKPLRQL